MPERKNHDSINHLSGLEENRRALPEPSLPADRKRKSAVHTYLFRPAERSHGNDKIYSVGFIDVYIPFLVAFVLSVINRFLTANGAFNGIPQAAQLTVKCISYIIIFALPAVIYCKKCKKKLHTELSLHRFSPSYIPFIIIGFLLLIAVIATLRISIAYFFPGEEAEQILYLGREDNKLGIILAYAIFPAICEELFLRGLVQNEISEKAGALSGIIVSSLTFALLHLDFKYFTVYFCSGLILAICAHVTNSVFPSTVLHIFNNLFSLLFSARLSFIASERTGNSFLIIILVFFVFILLLFYLKSLESLCVRKAYLEDIKNINAEDDGKSGTHSRMSYRKPYRIYASTGYTLHKFLRVIFSPALIVATVIFMFAVI